MIKYSVEDLQKSVLKIHSYRSHKILNFKYPISRYMVSRMRPIYIQFNQRHKNFQICLIMCTDFFLMKWALHRKKRKWHPSSEYVVLQDVVSECFLENNKILLTFVKICGSYNLHLSCQSPWGWTLWIWMLNMGSLQFAKTHGGAGVWVRVCNDKWRTFCKLTENNGALHCTPW